MEHQEATGMDRIIEDKGWIKKKYWKYILIRFIWDMAVMV